MQLLAQSLEGIRTARAIARKGTPSSARRTAISDESRTAAMIDNRSRTGFPASLARHHDRVIKSELL